MSNAGGGRLVPKYLPIDSPVSFESVSSDMMSLLWRDGGIVADFVIPGQDVLRVQFHRVHVIRVLDEMLLSTEIEASPNEGLVPNHFAYLVKDARFWNSQSPALFATSPDARHYRFITGCACLDVIADSPPTLTVEAAQ
jgi:hypothetical protein